jgi:hypothetical protein
MDYTHSKESVIPYVSYVQRQVLHDLKDLQSGVDVRVLMDSLIQAHNDNQAKCDSAVSGLTKLNTDLRGQNSLLIISHNQDMQLISANKKELRKQKVLKIGCLILMHIVVIATLFASN